MASGWYDFVAGAKPLASEWDDYIGKQTVMVFATAAARDTALSSAKRDGMVTYLQDAPKRLEYYDGSVWRTFLSEWVTWSPTYTNLTIGNGTVIAQYRYSGMRAIQAKWNLTMGTTSAVGTDPRLTLPVSPLDDGVEIDNCQVRMSDATGVRCVGFLYSVSGSTVGILSGQVSGTALAMVTTTSSVPFPWAVNDYMKFDLEYEI